MKKILGLIKNPKFILCVSILLVMIIFYKLNGYDNYSNEKKFKQFSLLVIIITYSIIFFYNKIIKWLDGLNSKQKIIIAILIPIFLYIVFYPFMTCYYYGNGNYYYGNGNYYGNNREWVKPTNFNYTWSYWLVYLGMIGFFEYKLFDKKKEEE